MVEAFHEPYPTLQLYPDFAFHNPRRRKLLSEVFFTARTEKLLKTYISGNKYIESNQCLTFFAPEIKKLIPKAKFVHVVRHPGDFIVSAIKKGWYKNDTIWEYGRVKSGKRNWDSLTQEEKLAWLWNATNTYIEEFKQELDPGSFETFTFEALTSNVADTSELLQFCNITDIPEGKLQGLIETKVNEIDIASHEPPNMFKTRDVKRFMMWEEDQRENLRPLLPLASLYNYNI